MRIAGLVLQLLGIGILIFDFLKYNPFSPIPQAEDYWAYRIGRLGKRMGHFPWLGKWITKRLGLNYYSEAFGYQEFGHFRQVVLLGCLILAGIGLFLQLIAVLFHL